MSSSGKKAFKSGMWYIVGNFIAKGSVFLVSPFFNRLMSTKDVGIFSNYSAWITIFSIICTFDLYSAISVARFDFRGKLDEVVGSLLVLGTLITGIYYLISIIFRNQIIAFTGFTDLEINIAFLYFSVAPALQMFHIRKRIEYKYKASTVITVVSVLLSSCVALGLVITQENKLLARIIGHYIPLILINTVVYVYQCIKGKKIRLCYWRYALAISIPLAIHLLAGNLLNMSDRIMIASISGKESAGLYSVAYNCGMIISILWGAINAAWSPWAYEQMDEKDYVVLKDKQKQLMAFWVILIVCIQLFSPEILYVMGGEKYMEAVYVIPPVMASYGIYAIITFYINIEIYNKRQVYIARNTIIAAFINIVMNYYFITTYGYIAAAYTTLLGYSILLLLHLRVVFKMKKDYLYDNRFNMFVAAFMIITMFVINALYQIQTVRLIAIILLIVISVVFVIKNWKILIDMIKTRSLNGANELVNNSIILGKLFR